MCSSEPFEESAPSGTHLCDLPRGEWLRLSAVPVFDAAWSPDSRRLATAGEDLRVTLWDTSAGLPVITLNTEAEILRFTNDGQFLSSDLSLTYEQIVECQLGSGPARWFSVRTRDGKPHSFMLWNQGLVANKTTKQVVEFIRSKISGLNNNEQTDP